MRKVALALLILSAILVVPPSADAESGIASVYSSGPTASGRPFSRGGMTAAHKSLPFGTRVRVTNKRTGRSVVVTITDRGPYVRGRIVDLTPGAARAIGLGYSVAPVDLSVVR